MATNPNAVAVAPDALEKAVRGEGGLNAFFGLNKDQVDAMAVLGFQLYDQGRNDEARAIFEGLIALDSRSYFGYAGLGALALAEEKLDEADTNLRKAIELKPEDPTVHANLGEVLLRQGKFEEAAAEFDKALELDPEEEDPGANRARAILDGMEVVINEVQRMQAQT